MSRGTVLAALAALALGTSSTGWAQQGLTITPVLKSSTTMTGQPLQYARTDRPEATIAVAELEPGGEVGRHVHWTSGFVYILDGTLTIEMEDGSRQEFKAGQAFVEATNTWHNARNPGNSPVKLLIVWPGEVGRPNIIRPGAAGAAGTTPGSASGGAVPSSGARPGATPQQ